MRFRQIAARIMLCVALLLCSILFVGQSGYAASLPGSEPAVIRLASLPDPVDQPLQPIGIPLAEGNGIAVAGASPANVAGCACPIEMTLTLPDDVEVKQVLLYWYTAIKGQAAVDETVSVTVDGASAVDLRGAKIGGPTDFFSTDGQSVYFNSFRVDATAEVASLLRVGGETVLTVELPLASQPDLAVESGTGLLVITEDGGPRRYIDVREGQDLAFFRFEDELQVTVPQRFAFDAAPYDREAEVFLLIGSEGTPQEPRPNDMFVRSGGVDYPDRCNGNCDSLWWDSHRIGNIPVASGATSIETWVESTVSDDPLGAPLNWVVAAVLVPEVEPEINLEREAASWSYTIRNPGPADLVNVAVLGGPNVAVMCQEAALAAGAEMTCDAQGLAAYHANAAWIYAESAVDGTPLVRWVEPD